ncbi:hypothetical protein H6G94_35465 [Nostoc punctiforme FACHB-252]|uniref:Uncharacterized protein n=1 Tax=Nostoc punctiforme FACHB-252 TaxID=1357509 RepID=A0ABR8HLQ9_NOSPU|nr:hypothetical protein [Nostoc punctiforme]MBD2616463.1 hypothetical protein [Nostoc punctiforme FACHB-252]
METTISITKGWQYPRFTFGQRTERGQIIGLKYYAEGTYLAEEYGTGWRYILLPDKNREDEEHCIEDELELLTPQELRTQIQAEIDSYSRLLELLKSELRAIPITVATAKSTAENEKPSEKKQQFSISEPNLHSLIDAAQFILKEIAKHPDFLTLEYQPDLTVGDAQTALDYLQSGLEDIQKFDITSNIFP